MVGKTVAHLSSLGRKYSDDKNTAPVDDKLLRRNPIRAAAWRVASKIPADMMKFYLRLFFQRIGF